MSPESKVRKPKGSPRALSSSVEKRVSEMANRYQYRIDRQAEALARLAKSAVALDAVKSIPATPMSMPDDVEPEQRQMYRRGYADAIKQVQEFIKQIAEE